MTIIKTLKVNMAFTSHFIFGMTFLNIWKFYLKCALKVITS